MAIVGIPVVLDDNIGVFFETGEHLLVGGYAFALNDTPKGLIVYLPGQIAVMLDVL